MESVENTISGGLSELVSLAGIRKLFRLIIKNKILFVVCLLGIPALVILVIPIIKKYGKSERIVEEKKEILEIKEKDKRERIEQEIENLKEDIERACATNADLSGELFVKKRALKRIREKVLPFLENENYNLKKMLEKIALEIRIKLFDLKVSKEEEKRIEDLKEQGIEEGYKSRELRKLKIKFERKNISHNIEDEICFLNSDIEDILSKKDIFLESDISMLEEERDEIVKYIKKSDLNNRNTLEKYFNGLIEEIEGKVSYSNTSLTGERMEKLAEENEDLKKRVKEEWEKLTEKTHELEKINRAIGIEEE